MALTSLTSLRAGAWAAPTEPNWQLRMSDDGPSANAAQAETLFALANGELGIRGGREEQATATDGAFLAGVHERVPIHYHEAFPGFARASDTRVPVADGKRIRVLLGEEAVDLAHGTRLACERVLDLRHGVLDRVTRWRTASGSTLEVSVSRLVPLQGGATLALRLSLRSIDYRGSFTLESCLEATEVAQRADDPRIGADAGAALMMGQRRIDGDAALLTQSARQSGIRVAVAQTHRVSTELEPGNPVMDGPKAVGQRFHGQLQPGGQVTIGKFVAWAAGSSDDALEQQALGMARAAASSDFDALRMAQAQAWDAFWSGADLGIDGDDSLDQAVHFDLFHLRQSSPADGRHALAAKGLTGQGYEGHVFWDTEVFALPVLQMTAPALARASLDWRVRTLEGARAHAREMNHAVGALYPWRTIAGDEGSGYFPSGSAQYHINAAVAFALRLHQLGAADGSICAADATVLFETARVWLQVGHFSRRRGGAFCIHSVTGPDEYSALVSNDYYTNRMAQLHLAHAADIAGRLAREMPATYREIATLLDLRESEPSAWRRAADAMYLPVDPRTGVHPQDDEFLDRPPWSEAAAPDDDRPLLLRYHPLTLYRHQVCKQPSVVLANVLAGDGIEPAQKQRDFDYYEPLTVHDSSLSACTWSIMAAELGDVDTALRYFHEGARLDLDDLHGNAGHGAHMASMAGAWLSLVWGLGGLRIGADGILRLRPLLPGAWRGYHFTLQWRGCRLLASVTASGVRYELRDGEELPIVHDGALLRIRQGASVSRPLAHTARLPVSSSVQAVIFDLDGVLTDTAELHFHAWSRLAAEIGVPFSREDNERLKGVDRATSLNIILERATREFDAAERGRLAAVKNGYFVELIQQSTPASLLPGALECLADVRARGVRIALASASHNAAAIVARLGIGGCFDAIVDPAGVAHPKPAPDIFLAAAAQLGVEPSRCIGVEDAVAGIEAIKSAGMLALGIGDPRVLAAADGVFPDLVSLGISRFLGAAGPFVPV